MRCHLLPDYTPNHIVVDTNHEIVVDVDRVELFCCVCRDQVYDHDFDTVVVLTHTSSSALTTLPLPPENLRKRWKGGYWPLVSDPRERAVITRGSRLLLIRNTNDDPNTSSSSSASWGLRGLNNLGNTCFMNSVLQALLRPPATTFWEIGTTASCANREVRRRPLATGGSWVCLACDLDAMYSSTFPAIGHLATMPSFYTGKLSSYLNVEDQKLFHSSAVYAAAIHTVSIPFRMELLGPTANSADVSGAMDVGGITQMLSSQARQNSVAIMGVAMPAPSLKDGQSQGSFLRSLHSLTPEIEENLDDMHAVESLIIHGALHSGSYRASIPQVNESVVAAYQSELSTPIFSHLSASLCPLPIPLPFPSIFRNSVGRHGELLNASAEGAQSRGSLEIDSVPMAVRLQSSRAIKPFIEKRLGSLRRYGMQRGAPGAELLRSWGFGRDEVEDMGESLARKVKALDPCTQASSDYDSD